MPTTIDLPVSANGAKLQSMVGAVSYIRVIDERTSKLEELDVEGILAFAECVLPCAADLWVQAWSGFRRKRLCWTRRNRTGFQVLAAGCGRKKIWWT